MADKRSFVLLWLIAAEETSLALSRVVFNGSKTDAILSRHYTTSRESGKRELIDESAWQHLILIVLQHVKEEEDSSLQGLMYVGETNFNCRCYG